MTEKMLKRTVRITEETDQLLAKQPQKALFMRNAIEKELTKNKEKMRIEIEVTFVNTGSTYHNQLFIKTHAIGNLKEKIIPLLDAVEDLQNIITFLDP